MVKVIEVKVLKGEVEQIVAFLIRDTLVLFICSRKMEQDMFNCIIVRKDVNLQIVSNTNYCATMQSIIINLQIICMVM